MKKQKKDRNKNKRIDEKHLLAYTLAAGATLAFSANADALINYTPADITLNNSDYNIDINGDDNEDFNIWAWANNSSSYNSASGGITPLGSAFWMMNGSWNPANLANGNLIHSQEGASWNSGQGALFYAYSGYQSSGNFGPLNPGYLGIKFNTDSGDRYGWIHIDKIGEGSEEDYSSIHINGWAYEDSGEAINAGDIGTPTVAAEPSSMALFAAGAAGMRAFKRRKKKPE